MKKFTCREMGGVCDAEISGETVEEVMQKGHEHVKGVEDDEHKKLMEDMNSKGEEGMKEGKEGFQKKWDEKQNAE